MKRTLVIIVETNDQWPDFCGNNCRMLVDRSDRGFRDYCGAFDEQLTVDPEFTLCRRTQQCLESAYTPTPSEARS